MALNTRINDLATRMGTEAKALRTLINGNLVDLTSLNTTDKTNLVNAINEVLAASGGTDPLKMDKASNLSDVADVATSRTNLDVRSTAEVTSEITAAIATVTLAALGGLASASNLSDVGDVATSRTNLDVRSTAQVTAEIAAAIATITLAGLGGLTQAEVDARVQLIVGAAPAALDTLVELSAALGDDANFATTITTALGNRVQYDAAQTLSAGQETQAQDNIQVYSRTQIGDPETNFVTTFNAALV